MKLLKQIAARIIFLPLILAAGIAITAMLAARVLITPEDLQSIVVNQFQEALKRPVRIEWARFSATGDIKIKGLRVTEPGPETMDFLTADYIYATYRLLPLLRRKVEIDSVSLVAPKIMLFRRANGTWNIGDIFAAYRDKGGRRTLSKIDEAGISEGEIYIADSKSGARYSFEHFNGNLKDFKPGGDSQFYASVFFKSNAFRRPVEGRLYTEGLVNFASFDWSRAEVKGLHADLTLLNKSAKITGTIKNFRRPEIALSAETPECRSSELAYLFSSPWDFTAPRSFWEISSVFTATKTAEIRLVSKPLNVRAEGKFDLSVSTPQYSFTIWAPPFNLAKADAYGAKLPVDNPSGKVQLRLKAASKNGKFSVTRIFVNTDAAGFRHRTLTVSELNLSALLSENLANSYATVTGGKLAMGKDLLTGLNLRSQVSKEELSLNYSGRLNGEPVKGLAVIRNPFAGEKTVDFTGYSRNLAYSEAKSIIFGAIDLRSAPKKQRHYDSQLAWLKTLKNSIPAGYAAFKLLYKADRFHHEYLDAKDFYASASLKNITGDITKMRGDISIKSGSGTFYQVEKTSEKDRVHYIFSLPLMFIQRMNRTGALKFGYKTNDISFNSIGGDYSLNSGKVQIKNFYMDGKEFSAYATGQLDFSDETMNLKIYTISGKYYAMGSLPESLTDASGKPALAFTLEGKMAKPDFKIIDATVSGKIIKDAALKGADIDFAKIDKFVGGKQ